MSVTLTERTKAGRRPRLFDPGGARTLEDAIGAVSQSLAVRGNARCLVCGATLIRCAEDEPNAPAAECAACASSLE
jgi:hypothetical protein